MIKPRNRSHVAVFSDTDASSLDQMCHPPAGADGSDAEIDSHEEETFCQEILLIPDLL